MYPDAHPVRGKCAWEQQRRSHMADDGPMLTMNIGRTASNAIKIKTDPAGGGLRAVECACCVTAGCGCSNVSPVLKSTIESTTQITVNGDTRSWNGSAAQNQAGFGSLSWVVTYSEGTICIQSDNGFNSVALLPEPLIPAECAFLGQTGQIGAPVTINGEAFRSVHAFPDLQITLNITFA